MAAAARLSIFAAIAALASGPAAACDPRASVVYQEAAPEDELAIANDSETGWRLTRIEIDLEPAAGDLVFDVAAGGRGISQHQAPFGPNMSAPPLLEKEDRKLTLSLKPLPAGGRTVFYLDLDDMSAGGGVFVSHADLKNARLRAWFERPGGGKSEAAGAFDDKATARLAPEACV